MLYLIYYRMKFRLNWYNKYLLKDDVNGKRI